MKCTWFCNCAHLQDFSFFVCSLINCATGEFLGGADRKLAAPPAHLQCHGSATVVLYHFTSYTGEQRLAVVMLEAMHSSFSLSFLVLLFFHAHLSMLTAWSTRSWQAGQAQSLGWSCSLSLHTSALLAELSWTQLWTIPLLGEITWFHTPIPAHPWYPSVLLPGPLSLHFSWLQAQWQCFALRVEHLCALFCVCLGPGASTQAVLEHFISLRPLFCNTLGFGLNLFAS